ncbi:serine/threonine-protein kinase [Streptomyces tagetis]|uniref:PQQ-binding-like beta-propeller repeat protein n=1 Tax=Streptomyces tagetis TaxID=2820809 RepID=A0A940XIM9_9ACTN|nr:serine/threonine-protein kinase [Streptomyces sp. RG38]MBQ0827256.1 PQQ-binding-like beta-propeller repeat protein [Streptomyces sp. RG38]
MAPERNAGPGAEAEHPEYAGHYRLDARLGSGGMGVVHLARSTSGMRLAVKVVHARYARDPEFRGRFRQEVAAARRVSGAFTAPVVDADPDAVRPWMATLFIPGPTLADEVKRNGPLEHGRLRRLMAGLAEALRDIHRVGVVHRDLKPGNVLLAEDGPKVIDFGISRPKDSELRTETGKLIGTPPFMAPEQFRRPREVGPAADVFALGSLLVHAATGRGPFDSDSPYVVAYQVVHDEPDLTGLPESLAPLVRSCLAKEPEERPTPDELMLRLRTVAASYDTQAFTTAPRDPSQDTPGALPDGMPEGDTPGGHRTEADTPGVAEGDTPGDDRPERDTPDTPGTPRTDTPGACTTEPDTPGTGTRTTPTDAVTDTPRPHLPRRRARRFALGAGVVGVAVAGALVLVLPSRGTDPRAPVPQAAASPFGTWRTAPDEEPGVSHCSYGGGRLLCARPGLVFALAPSDGKVLWRHPVARTVVGQPPSVADGLVQPAVQQGTTLTSLDPATGATAREGELPAYQGLRRAGGMLLLTGADGRVTGVDTASGEPRWTRPVPGHQTPYFAAFPGDRLAYATSTGDDGTRTRVTAVDPATGTVRWDTEMDGVVRPVGTSGGSLCLLAVDPVYGDTRAVLRYTPGTGDLLRVTLPVPLAQAEATVRGDRVYLMGDGGSLRAVDLAGRVQRWSLETGMSRGSAPVADDRHVYVAAPDGRLLGVDAGSGRLLGQTPPRLGTASDTVPADLAPPVLAGGHVFSGAPDGSVLAVDARDPAAW